MMSTLEIRYGCGDESIHRTAVVACEIRDEVAVYGEQHLGVAMTELISNPFW